MIRRKAQSNQRAEIRPDIISLHRLGGRWLVAQMLVLLAASLVGAEENAFGPRKRVPWNSNTLTGSPEPPLPFTVEKTFTRQTWKSPLYIADEPGGSKLWAVEAGGDAKNPSRIVRISNDPSSGESETLLELPNQLIYSVCFHPEYLKNGFVYLFTNGPRENPERFNRITRYTVGRTPPYRVDPSSAELVIEWKSAGHDGGDMTFGLDKYLYLTTGDGTSDSDGWNSGQTLDDLLGAVLRIDVDHRDGAGARHYSVPRDNPFVGTPGARPEIWAYGLRNPWRMCTDPKTGHIWVGNNGQDLWETAHLIGRGENYGWSVYEGSHPFYLERKRGPTPHVPPTIEHSHADFRSLTGGVVYHGSKFPAIDGAYIYGDYSSGRIWAMKHDGAKVLEHREIADTSLQIASFRVDQRGELLITDHGGGFYRLIDAPKVERPPFPTLLSRTGLFRSVSGHQLDPSMIPYSVNAPGWADGATAERFFAVPGDSKVGYDQARGWDFPDGSALGQTLSLERRPGDPTSRFRVETRLLLRQQGEWAGYSYRWNAQQTDAALVSKSGENTEFAFETGTSQTWRFPSRSECMACHSRAGKYILGVTGSQLNRDQDHHGLIENQLQALNDIELFAKPLDKSPQNLEKLLDPRDASQDLERRARVYLDVNCAVCHVEAGGGNAQMQLALATPREKMGLLSARPQHDTFGIDNAMLAAPGSPDRSVLIHRLSHRGRGQMPPLVSNQVDEAAVRLFRDWIAGLKPELPFVRDWNVDELLPELGGLKSRPAASIESGKKAFRETGCLQCHKIEGEGGTVGPDLAGVGRRLSPKDLLESVLLPSKVIADEYAVFQFEMRAGTVAEGRVEREDENVVIVRPPSAFSNQLLSLDKRNIVERRRSPQSNMPQGVVNVLQKEQVLDLLAYLLSDPQPQPQPQLGKGTSR